MYKIFLVSLVSILSFSLNGLKAQRLSPQAEISIITCAPGNDLYSTFGHSAIRIKDPAFRMDNVYNYGTFNFETPNFYVKFVRGQLDYMLSVAPYRYFVMSYMNENRWIKEQILDLSAAQKNKVYSYLEKNALPENKYYRYDFFYDNCATRVKDVIKDVLKDDLILPETVTKEGETFRDLTHIYLAGKDWERFGTNLALGRPTDKIINTEEATFIPDYLYLAFDKAKIKTDGIEKSVIKESKMLFEPKNRIETTGFFFTPIIIFSLVLFFVLLMTYFEKRTKRYYLLFDKTLFFIVGFIGIVILFLWFGTEHIAVVNNLNIIWAMPLFFVAAFMLKAGNKQSLKWFFLVMSLVLLISLILKLFSLCLYDFTIIPLVLILILRSYLIFNRK